MRIAPEPTALARRFASRPPRAQLRTVRLGTPIGELLLEGDGHLLTRLELPVRVGPADKVERGASPSLAASAQLLEYFAGERQDFDLDLAPEGTPFQLSVWSALLGVGYGRTATYGEIAARVGNPRASRAVGMANNRNPIAIVVPCHRVIGASGDLVGYGGGLDTKRHLLALEGALGA